MCICAISEWEWEWVKYCEYMKEGSLQSPDVYLYIISSTILDKVFILREYMKEGSLQSLDVPLYLISSKVTTTHVHVNSYPF